MQCKCAGTVVLSTDIYEICLHECKPMLQMHLPDLAYLQYPHIANIRKAMLVESLNWTLQILRNQYI